MDTSKEAYEAAAERWEQTRAARNAAYAIWLKADQENGDAETALRAHEVAPGVPAWSHPADSIRCRVPNCRIHAASA